MQNLDQRFSNFFGSRRIVKHITNFLAHFVYKIKNILIYFKLWIKISIQMSFFSFLKYTFIIFAAHLAISCGAPFENHFSRHLNPICRISTYTLKVYFKETFCSRIGLCDVGVLIHELFHKLTEDVLHNVVRKITNDVLRICWVNLKTKAMKFKLEEVFIYNFNKTCGRVFGICGKFHLWPYAN
jgi:hypothetical protein